MKNKILAMALVMILIMGFIPEVKAAESVNLKSSSMELYDTYEIEYDTNGARHIKNSEIQIIDGRMNLVTTFSNGSMIDINFLERDGNKVQGEVSLDSDADELTVRVPITSLDNDININMTVTVSYINMVHTYDIYIKDIRLADGVYDIDYESNGTRHIKNTQLNIQDGEMTLETIFNNGTMIDINFLEVNGTEIDGEISLDEEADQLMVRLPIESLDDDVNINMTVTVAAINMVHTYDIYINDIRLPSVEIYDGSEDEIEEDDDENNSVSYDTYEIEYDTNGSRHIKNSEIQIIDGRMNLVTTFSSGSMIDINFLERDGNKVQGEVSLDSDADELTVIVPMTSLDNDININMTVTVAAINMVHTYDIYIRDIKLVNGTYDIDCESNGTRYIKSTQLDVQDGEMTLKTIFGSGSLIDINFVEVNDTEIESEIIKDNEADELTVITPIESLDDDININMTVTVAAINMVHTYDIYINNMRLKDVEIYDGSEDEETDDSENDDNNENGDEDGSTGSDTNDNLLKDGNYTIENKILKTGTNETSYASEYLDKEGKIRVEDGNYYFTLGIKEMGVLTNLGAVVDGRETDIESVINSDGTGSISFKINSLSSTILVKCKIVVTQLNYVNDTDFNVKLDKSTLRDENGDLVETPEEEVEIPLYKNAVYSIQNSIGGISEDSQIAAFVDPNSIIEVEDEKMYLKITFLKSGFMDGRVININNSSSIIRPTIESDTNNKMTIKFNISSLNDIIKFSALNKSIEDEFTISLLADTLVEQTTTSSGSDSNSGSSSDDDDDDDLDDGTYTIKNKVLKEDSDDESHAREYLNKESLITVKNGKIYLTLKFTHGKMMSSTSIKVDGSKTSYTTVKNSGNNYHIKFKIGSLDDEILVTTTIDTGISSIGSHDGVKFRVVLRESTLDEYDEDDEDDEDEEEEETTSSSNTSNGSQTNGSTGNVISGNTVSNTIDLINSSQEPGVNYKREVYSINNEIVTDSSFGYQAARGAVVQDSYMYVEDGKNFMVVTFKETDVMNNIRLALNGNNLSYDILSDQNNTMTIKFEVPSTSAQIDVTANIAAMGRDTTFGLKFLDSTLTHIRTEESVTPITEPISEISGLTTLGTAGSQVSSGSSSGSSKGSTSSTSKSVTGASEGNVAELSNPALEAKEYYKTYTVENEIVSDSMMGRTMARKYLNSISTVDEIDGQLYLTLTFSGADSMENFTFAIGNENREYSEIIDESNDMKIFKFKIDSMSDVINVGIYVKPMKMNISFGVKLNENTMVLVDEGEVSSEENGKESSEEFLEKSLSVHQNSKTSNNGELTVFKIAIVTSLMTTGMNAALAGIIYLVIKRKKKVKKSAQ